MTDFPLELYLLFIILVITTVCLFLCLFNALFLFDISKRIRRLKIKTGTPGQMQIPAAAVTGRGTELSIPLQTQEDIATGIRTIAGKYHVDSLVVAMPDGFLVASAGSHDPEYDAAYYSSLFTGDYTTPEKGIWLAPIDHRGISLIGIARNRDAIPRERIVRMTEDLQMLFERRL